MKQKKKQNNVKFIPLTQNVERAKHILFHLFECYPYNPNHPKYGLCLKNYHDKYFNSKIWQNIWKEMYKSGNINKFVVSQSNLEFFIKAINGNGHFDIRITNSIVKNIVNHVIPKIPSKHSNFEYRETGLFSILKEFLLLTYSYLQPEGITWNEFLANPLVGNEYWQFLKPLRMKEISSQWKEKMLERSNEIREKWWVNMSESNKSKTISILQKDWLQRTSADKNFLQSLISELDNLEEKESIPRDYQSQIENIADTILDFTEGKISLSFPKSLNFPPMMNSYSKEIKFGLAPQIFFDFIGMNNQENEKYEYELKEVADIILTSEQFREQLNEIFKIFFGHANIQLDSDGILRYQESKHETYQIHALIESFVSKKLSILTPQLDKLILLEERGEWKELTKYSRILFEDYLRVIFKKRRIRFSLKSPLKPLIKILRNKQKKIFKFPNWVLDDPFKNFDNYLLGLKYMGDLLNPNNHTENIIVSKKDAISLKNSLISILITLTGFLK